MHTMTLNAAQLAPTAATADHVTAADELEAGNTFAVLSAMSHYGARLHLEIEGTHWHMFKVVKGWLLREGPLTLAVLRTPEAAVSALKDAIRGLYN